MNEGILDVLLVSAKNIRKKAYIGKPKYYVVIQCGDQKHRSKITSGKDRKALWNEKFTFKFSYSDWQNTNHLKLKIMDKERLSKNNFIGETIVHLGGIITEGNEKGFLEVKPAPYNVVLEDDTYKGEIKIGLKFTSTAEMHTRSIEYILDEQQRPWSICRRIYNMLGVPWWKIFSVSTKSSSVAWWKAKIARPSILNLEVSG